MSRDLRHFDFNSSGTAVLKVNRADDESSFFQSFVKFVERLFLSYSQTKQLAIHLVTK